MKPTILIVEDDDAVRQLLLTVCANEGYRTMDTVSGRDALALVTTRHPDVVVLDWGLPDLSGIEVCRELRAMGLKAPIILLTGRGSEVDVETGLREGADDYVIKPVRPRDLAARLRAHLRRVSHEGEAAEPDDLKARAEFLSRVSIFSMEPAASLRSLTRKIGRRRIPKGTTLLAEGSENETLFLIETGSFQVSLKGPAERPLPISVLATTDFIGITSTMHDRRARATVTALEDSEVLTLARSDLQAILEEGEGARSEVEKVIAQRRTLLNGGTARVTHSADHEADVIAIYSPKGGVGKTTIAVNLAASLARQHRGDVLLVDLSLPFNHAALLANLAPSTCLARLSDTAVAFEELLESATAYHPDGFLVLSTALTPEEADLISPALVTKALAALRGQFRFILVDLGVTLTETALSVLERSDHVVLVATPELSMMKDLAQIRRILGEVLNVPLGRTHLVLNQRSPTDRVRAEDVESVVTIPVATVVRHEGRRPEEAALRGEIFVLTERAGSVAKACAELSRLLVGTS